jgi:hypothetical protein
MSEAQLKHNPFADALKRAVKKERPGTPISRAMDRVRTKKAKKDGYKDTVSANTPEFARIMNIPVRELDLEDVTDLTCIFRKAGGTMDLHPIQSAALIEAYYANGLFGAIVVGGGKTLISLLLAEAMDSKRTVLIVPAQLRDQLAREIDEVYGPHFNLPLERIVRILSYSELSLAKNTDLLDELDADLIVLDEAHKLANPNSARTKRFRRYMRESPHCRLAALSGTMTGRSIIDYAHILELCLRKNSPLPKDHEELKLWAGALDVKPPRPIDPGALRLFLAPEDGDNVRLGFRRRLTSTLGVVATQKPSLDTSLIVTPVTPDYFPEEVQEALDEVGETWEYNGEVFASPVSYWRFCRQMSNGFYYRWVWPNGAPDEKDIEWLEARASWKRATREKLKTAGVGMDSELLLNNAAERWRKKIEDHSKCDAEPIGEDHSDCEYRKWVAFEKGSEEWADAESYDYNEDAGDDFAPGEYVTECIHGDPNGCTGEPQEYVSTDCKLYPEHLQHCTGRKTVAPKVDAKLFQCEEYIAWKKVKGLYNPTPPTEAVVISNFTAVDAIARAKRRVKEGRTVIIWYAHRVIGELLEKLSGWPKFGAGADASGSCEDVIICSIETQGTGKNLQHYNHNQIVTMPTNGKKFEQLAGRSHRPGQHADKVTIDYNSHTESLSNCMDSVIADALYIQDSTGQRQKILCAEGEVIQQKKLEQQLIIASQRKFMEDALSSQN